MPPFPAAPWLDDPLVQRFEDRPDEADPHPCAQVWLRPRPPGQLRITHALRDQLVWVASEPDGAPCMILMGGPLLGDGLVRLVSQLLAGSRPCDDNPFNGCPFTPDGLRGLIAALERASAMLPVPSTLSGHPDAPRAA